jgi:hypothetical protein
MGDSQFVRDLAVMAMVFGFAAFVWFGWGQEAPPQRWRLLLAIGSGLGLLLAIVGGVLTWRSWGPQSALAAQDARRAFGITCGVEFGLAGLGAGVLGTTKRPQWIAPWVALVVGVHFVPLAYIFGDPGLLVPCHPDGARSGDKPHGPSANGHQSERIDRIGIRDSLARLRGPRRGASRNLLRV